MNALVQRKEATTDENVELDHSLINENVKLDPSLINVWQEKKFAWYS